MPTPPGPSPPPCAPWNAAIPSFWTELERACAERACRLLVVGLPRRLDGGEGPAAAAARSFAADAGRRLGLDVAMWDEWLTTAQAERVLIEGGVRRADRRGTVDAMAATLILQSYLDAHPRRPSP